VKRRVVGKVQVLGSTVTIVETDQDAELRDDKGVSLNGFYQDDHNVIVIDSRLPADVKNEILRHEIGHCVFERQRFADDLLEIATPADAEKFEENLMRSFLPQYTETIANMKVKFK
jgi:Zn-dependent peptidase ImmA (M78 family)